MWAVGEGRRLRAEREGLGGSEVGRGLEGLEATEDADLEGVTAEERREMVEGIVDLAAEDLLLLLLDLDADDAAEDGVVEWLEWVEILTDLSVD